VLDEIQRAPLLFSYLQTSVDRDPSPGRFVLIGSENLLLMEEIARSLAGQCGVLHLLPLSRAELAGQAQGEPADPGTLFSNREAQGAPWELLRTGFFPQIHDRHAPPEAWLADYLETYVERDIKALTDLDDLPTFQRFLRLCAGHTGQILSLSALGSDCGIAVDTARRWFSVLVTSFIVFLLPPFHRSFNKRVIKRPKVYFCDTGLACHLLGIQTISQLEVHPLRGALFENYILAEVAKAYWNHHRTPPIHFWRDRTGHEVDLLVEESGKLYPIEITSDAAFASDLLAPLRWWDSLARNKASQATLVHAGTESFTHTGVDVRPWFAI
jgi:uncharacterized protein